MKIKFTRSLEVEYGSTYMCIEEQEKRPDIQAYLQGLHHISDPKLNEGVERYLTALRLKKNGVLTVQGDQVRESGYLPACSEGKYAIWYVQDPILDAPRIIYYDRMATASEDRNWRKGQELRVGAIERAQSENSEFVKATLTSNRLFVVKHYNKEQERIDMIRQLTVEGGESRAVRYYLGTLKGGADRRDHTLRSSRPAEEDVESLWVEKLLPQIAKSLSGQWRGKEQRIALPLDDAKKLGAEALKHFSLNCSIPRSQIGEVWELEHVGIMPMNELEAKKWFDHLLSIEAEKDYLQQGDIDALASLRNEVALEPYRAALNTPKATGLARGAKDNKISYWHLMAPRDLMPDGDVHVIDRPVSLVEGEQHSMSAIVEKLGLRDVRWVAYCDRYVVRPWQQSYIGGLLQAIKAERSIVITQKSDMMKHPSGKTFLEQHKGQTQLEIIDVTDVFEKSRGIHDRCLVVCDAQGNLKLWTGTNGLTTFDYQGNGGGWKDFGPKTPLRLSDSVTLSPVELRTQDKLITYLKKHFHVK